jgi:uncharacterized RDD family membrane protein YckC
MGLLHVKTTFNIDLHFETAQFHRRFFAWLIDIIIIGIYQFVMELVVGSSMSLTDAEEFGITTILFFIPVITYHFFFEMFMRGQSPGKYLMHIHVVSLTGKSPSVSQLWLRWLSRFIDFGFLWGLICLAQLQFVLGALLIIASIISFVVYVSSPANQRLGDMIAGTTVVSKKLPYSLHDTIFKDLDMRTYQPVFMNVLRLSDKDINIIDNIVKHNNQSSIENYLEGVAEKIKKALDIETDMPSDMFLETLLRDYNFLSRK